MQIVIATSNAGKLREFRRMLDDAKFSFVGLTAFGHVHEVEETGQSFAENAAIKAAGYARQTGSWALADDSGLTVEALGGAPGIFSARWAERHGRVSGDEANNRLLLEQMANIPDSARAARFVCALALADVGGRIVLTAEDFVEGFILRRPRGSNGFGYDPLFYLPDLHRTAAELSPDEKSWISHRGRALRQMKGSLGRFAGG